MQDGGGQSGTGDGDIPPQQLRDGEPADERPVAQPDDTIVNIPTPEPPVVAMQSESSMYNNTPMPDGDSAGLHAPLAASEPASSSAVELPVIADPNDSHQEPSSADNVVLVPTTPQPDEPVVHALPPSTVQPFQGLEFSELCYRVRVRPTASPSTTTTTTTQADALDGSKQSNRRWMPSWLRPKVNKMILNKISGKIPLGTLCCIIGPSGCGKSTFLDFISGRLAASRKSGTALFNGATLSDSKTFGRTAGYVMQNDVLLPTATVKEMLTYAALLRLPSSMSRRQKLARVASVISDLGLNDCANTKIGNEMIRGISGGQKRRVSIGMELLSEPSLLLLDEPTSGLDSFSAHLIIRTLAKLAHTQNKCIVASVHQPSSELFRHFDMLMVLGEGKLVYLGPAQDAFSHFASVGYPLPANTNPCDHFIDLVSPTLTGIHGSAVDVAALEDSDDADKAQIDFEPISENDAVAHQRKMARIDKLHNALLESKLAYQPSDFMTKYENEAGNLGKRTFHRTASYIKNEFLSCTPPLQFLNQFFVLCTRMIRNIYRDPLMLLSQAIQYIFIALFVGLMYFQADLDQKGARDRVAALFFVVVGLSWIPAMVVVATFPQERNLFTRERLSNLYQTSTYFIAFTCVSVPIQIVFPLLFSIVCYPLVGFQITVEQFFIFVLFVILIQEVSESIGLMIGTISKTVDLANLYISVVFTLLMAVSSFVVNSENLRWYFYPLAKISPFTYGYEALLLNEFRDIPTITCADEKAHCTLPDINLVIQNMTVNLKDFEAEVCPLLPCPLPDGMAVVNSFGVKDHNLLYDAGAMLIMWLVWRALAYLCLRFVRWEKK